MEFSKRHFENRDVWPPVRSVVIAVDYKSASTLVSFLVFFNNIYLQSFSKNFVDTAHVPGFALLPKI